MKLAIFIDSDIKSGGHYHQCLKTADILAQISHEEIDLIIINTNKKNNDELSKIKIKSFFYHINFIDRVFFLLYSSPFWLTILKKLKIKNKFEKYLLKNQVDLIYFVGISRFSLFCNNHNFISYIYEIHHLFRPDLPEYKGRFGFELRESLLNYNIKKSLNLIVDTKRKKEDLIKYYNCIESKIKIIPLCPNLTSKNLNLTNIKNLDVKKIIEKKIPYYFYPAQYWSHKNHNFLLDTIKQLKKDSIDLTFVFTGQKKNNYNFIYNKTHKENLIENVVFFDYLKDEDIVNLYKSSKGLIMPSLIGNSSLPLYEAFYYEVPVFYTKNLLDDEMRKFVTEFDIEIYDSLYKILKNLDHQKIKEKVVLAKNYYENNIEEKNILKKYNIFLRELIYKSKVYSS